MLEVKRNAQGMLEIKRGVQKAPQTAQKPATASVDYPLKENTTNTQDAAQGRLKPSGANCKKDLRKLYPDIFEFHSKYSPPRMDDLETYWDEAGDAHEALRERYVGDLVAEDLVVRAFDDLMTQAENMQAAADREAAGVIKQQTTAK